MDADNDDEEEPSYAALGGRPRSVDFDKDERQPRQQRSKRETDHDSHSFVVNIHHVFKREAGQEMVDIDTTRVIQVSDARPIF